MATVTRKKWQTAKGEKQGWRANYKDASGKWREKLFPLKRDAEAFLKKVDRELADGTHTPDSISLTVAQAGERWVQAGRDQDDPPLEQSTIVQREGHVRLHITPFLGATKLSQLTTPRVHLFIDQLRDNGRSLAMRRKVLTSLKSMITWAQGRGLVAQNAALPVRLSSRGNDRVVRDIELEIPSKADLRRMIAAADDKWRAFLITATFTGMRMSELRGLIWQNVDLDSEIIHVKQRADLWGKIGLPKSKAGTREIGMAPMVAQALREWRLAYPRPITGRDKKGDPIRAPHDPSHLVFPSGTGRVISHTHIAQRFLAPLQVELGIIKDSGEKDDDGNPIMVAKWSPHALRHAAASAFIAQPDWNLKDVQLALGHSSSDVTLDIYGKLFPEEKNTAARMVAVQDFIMETG